ncbi:DUF427 domain-containing protein [Phaeobacter sp. B1627]|uniref:DUF427 domain-containing protein n=1 Tax=Phaeobacter sp. B1627 TaxID=2583809 RepID=UPI00111995FA|nr:DUF427 domain-containing protein [Phaeobacter sp. B1627]TNJ46309.1 DUF427 domain-containing protein [Phaeobacter sp. B1627]
MNIQVTPRSGYGILVEQLDGPVAAYHGNTLLARSSRAKVMYETRLSPVVYFPKDDLLVDMEKACSKTTFCPFKGTAHYRSLVLPGEKELCDAAWSYDDALPEAHQIQGHVGFIPEALDRLDLGHNRIEAPDYGNISGPLVDWLLREAAFLPTPEEFTLALVHKLQEQGLPISRLTILSWALHPRIAGHHYLWEKGVPGVKTMSPSYEIHEKPEFKNSPLRHVSKGLGGLRYRLSGEVPSEDFPILKELRDRGATDYVAMPLPFSDGRINVLTAASDQPEGFSTADLGLIFECSAVIARYYEVFMQRENAQAVLETYVGKRSGARVLGGNIRRGDGDEIDAAIMFCDLRGSTLLEEALPRDKYIRLLNQFFETTSDVVHENGGEVLKFIGDAVLAVFPAGQNPAEARAQALTAARAIVAALAGIEPCPTMPHLECAIGIASGSVLYGNIGSQERLDFTVIGQAANIAARLGDYGKTAGHRIVVSRDILTEASDATPLGHVKLHNVTNPVESFAIAAELQPPPQAGT